MHPAVFVLLAAFLSSPFAGLSQVKAPYESDPKFIAALAEAKQLMQRHDYNFARDAYNKASKISGGTCAACLDSLFDLDFGLRKFKDAQADASRLVETCLYPGRQVHC